MSVNFSLSKAGLEVYTTVVTQEESKDSKKSKKSKDSKDKKTETSNNTNTLKISDPSDENAKFTLQNGEITEIDYVGELYSDNYEEDYSDISSNASIVLPMDYYGLFYKGRKAALKKGVQENNKFTWEDMDTAVLGFITELSYNQDKINIKINGMDKLLDQEKKFKFKKMKLSKIVTQIIEASGLKAKVNPKGLNDKVTSFTNITSSGSSSSSSSVDTSTELGKVVAKIIGDETDDYQKLLKIHNWGRKEIVYGEYECTHHNHDPQECYKHRKHINCGDTAILLNAMYKLAGLTSWIIHGDYHFWVIVEIGNKKYASDGTGDRPLNKVWSGNGHHNTPFGGSRVSEKAICG